MKVSKDYLKKLIKEEINKIKNEGQYIPAQMSSTGQVVKPAQTIKDPYFGKQPAKSSDAFGPEQTWESTCPICKGSGQIGKYLCPVVEISKEMSMTPEEKEFRESLRHKGTAGNLQIKTKNKIHKALDKVALSSEFSTAYKKFDKDTITRLTNDALQPFMPERPNYGGDGRDYSQGSSWNSWNPWET
jgi:hypothetical protein